MGSNLTECIRKCLPGILLELPQDWNAYQVMRGLGDFNPNLSLGWFGPFPLRNLGNVSCRQKVQSEQQAALEEPMALWMWSVHLCTGEWYKEEGWALSNCAIQSLHCSFKSEQTPFSSSLPGEDRKKRVKRSKGRFNELYVKSIALPQNYSLQLCKCPLWRFCLMTAPRASLKFHEGGQCYFYIKYHNPTSYHSSLHNLDQAVYLI